MPDLSLPVTKLWSETGIFLGFGAGAPDDATWTARVEKRIKAIVESGLRQFYVPAPTEAGGSVHEWSFLKPSTTLALATDESRVVLPHDFGYPDGRVTVGNEDGTILVSDLPLTGFPYVRQLRAENPTTTGAPRYGAVEPVKMVNPAPQTWALEIYPTADDDYEITLCYALNPSALTGSNPYAYGGAAHAETILESCLAIAEQRLDDVSSASGVHGQKFRERLAASIAYDRRLKPQALGYNGDNSDLRERGAAGRQTGQVTVNGVLYSGD